MSRAVVVGAAVADRRVAGDREVLPRLEARDAADLPPAQRVAEHAAAIAHERNHVGVGEHRDMTPVERRRSVVEVDVERIFRVVADAAGVGQHARQRVARRHHQIALALRRIQLQRVIVRDRVAAALADRRVALVRTQRVGRRPLRRRQQLIRRQRVERRLIDVRLPDQIAAAIADVGRFDEVALRQLALHAHAVLIRARRDQVRAHRIDLAVERVDRRRAAARIREVAVVVLHRLQVRRRVHRREDRRCLPAGRRTRRTRRESTSSHRRTASTRSRGAARSRAPRRRTRAARRSAPPPLPAR